MQNQVITYKGKKYEVTEPTIEAWTKLAALQQWTDEKDFIILLISHITGLTKEEVEQTEWEDTYIAAKSVSDYLTIGSQEFKNEFEFDGKKYRFIDLPNLKFGEFVDIDTFLTKSPEERQRELHVLMAMLYREVDENNNLTPYDGKLLSIRAEKFKKLPVNLVHGASTFFLRIEKILRGNIKLSFKNRWKIWTRLIWMFVKTIALISFGVGLGRLSIWLKKISRRWTR